jgi:hypothetical protein
MSAIGKDYCLGASAACHIYELPVVAGFLDYTLGGGGAGGCDGNNPVHGKYIAETDVNQFSKHAVSLKNDLIEAVYLT